MEWRMLETNRDGECACCGRAIKKGWKIGIAKDATNKWRSACAPCANAKKDIKPAAPSREPGSDDGPAGAPAQCPHCGATIVVTLARG